ncbi:MULTISPECIES: 1-(5-phosphoribosyl)-5-((5-phosphoribosylamino)methylideneamino)imidazole-4-carboxamide isomerase [Acidianus]|uniref:1-(5-phosphoribosyl)-5-[(5-phosphoribosylamino)methylideneamino] imidazole-4-carboxamide isomerase n=1 Tax=Candidatus Acidianus copahuensis TaxID=1160895 RepID=A0A031LRM9_9CREN|nr:MULTISPECIES: 1-(5-phosphoribosyl)-5-((5-phosphoribosylamino)methylideneamino)imidazole-4-carboxamide isomerase [Acidianus]EZQ11027.1 1-(5-phosphoribosyl)-5-[(5-phosphoribosylamino)methylideneamino] imidazole-4-carboxamide isomerase [Candidatus Acidianus copahuensis]NON62602.1 1-(5-phosphoribosyl)-5-((5-phosphoribosylamino)methylideneamino)imidazole-4-carboxamide isomerase [Acidianus sp. RZ1]
MKVVPSIDISKGKAVKRIKGIPGSGKIIGDPYMTAIELFSQGYDFIHIVDLDASDGSGENESEIEKICSVGFKKVEVGGGVRSLSKAEKLLTKGVTDVVISTLPFKNQKEFENLMKNHSSRIMLSIDYCKDQVLISGWKETVGNVSEVIKRLSYYEPEGFIFTYVCNEGTQLGIDDNASEYIKYVNGLKGYAGGIGGLEDLIKIKVIGFDFSIVGMAFYSGKLRGVKYV